MKYKGGALVEFMLVIPVFLVLVGGLVDTSILLYNKTIITHAGREGARYGVVLRSGNYAAVADVQSYTQDYCTGKMISFGGSPNVTVAVIPSAVDPEFGDTLSVTVNFQYTGLNFFLNIGQQNLSTTTVMSYE